MTPQQQNRIRQLEAERDKKREALRQDRIQLNREENAYMRTRQGGHNIGPLRDEIHLKELALEGIERDLERARQPQPIIIPVAARASETQEEWLLRARSEIEHKRDFRHAQHEQQVEHLLQPYKDAPEAHRRIIYNNHFSSSEHSRREADAADQRLLDEIAQRLAALGQPEPTAVAS